MIAKAHAGAAFAPAPFEWQPSGRPGSNGLFNIYVVDRDGRKVAAVWGRPGEKERTAALFVAAPAMVDALRAAEEFIEAELELRRASGFEPGTVEHTEYIAPAERALALARTALAALDEEGGA